MTPLWGSVTVQLDLSRASSLTPSICYLDLKPCSEEVVTETVSRVHTKSEIHCEEDLSISKTPVLPFAAKRRSKSKTNQEKSLLAGKFSKDSSRDEARRTRNRVSARNSRKRKRGRFTQSMVYRNWY
jgi:hypothetical protein